MIDSDGFFYNSKILEKLEQWANWAEKKLAEKHEKSIMDAKRQE